MKKIITLLGSFTIFISLANAQSVADKLNKTNSNISNTNNSVNNTSGEIDSSGKIIHNFVSTVGGLLKKKKKDSTAQISAAATAVPATPVVTTNTIVISVAGADYASLKKLKESIKAVAGVQSVDMTYSSAGSSLSTVYNKNAGDLWDGLSDDMAAKYNIISLNDNAINVAYKP